MLLYFNPRFPRGKRPDFYACSSAFCSFQSTLPAREATIREKRVKPDGTISIHASREGSDNQCFRFPRIRRHFNPRFPRGKRHTSDMGTAANLAFQSTLPAREATTAAAMRPMPVANFNPRFPRGKRPKWGAVTCLKLQISIHASREGSDESMDELKAIATKFQSTLPAREATNINRIVYNIYNFNPRFPRGKRLAAAGLAVGLISISIHASREGSDVVMHYVMRHSVLISIHASREGSDLPWHQSLFSMGLFQSTLPAGEATAMHTGAHTKAEISIHASRGGSDGSLQRFTAHQWDFNPRFPRGKRPETLHPSC